MNKLIQFEYKISDNEFVLLELQGELSHTVEKNYHECYLGKLEKKSEVNFTNQG